MTPRLTNSIVLCKWQSMLLARRKTWNRRLMIFNWMGLVAVTKVNVFPTRLVDPSWLCRSPLRCTHPCPLPQAPLAAVVAWGTDAPGSHPQLRPNYRPGPAGKGGRGMGGGRERAVLQCVWGKEDTGKCGVQVGAGCRKLPGVQGRRAHRQRGSRGGAG